MHRKKIFVNTDYDTQVNSLPENFDISQNEFMPSQKFDHKFMEILV